MDKMIPRNSVIPTKKVKMYTTTVDNQDTIEIEVSRRWQVQTSKLLIKIIAVY